MNDFLFDKKFTWKVLYEIQTFRHLIAILFG